MFTKHFTSTRVQKLEIAQLGKRVNKLFDRQLHKEQFNLRKNTIYILKTKQRQKIQKNFRYLASPKNPPSKRR